MEDKIKARIEQLKGERERMIGVINAYNGAIAELEALLKADDPKPED